MTSGQIINKRNGFALCLIIAILLISMIGIAVGSIAKGEDRNPEDSTISSSRTSTSTTYRSITTTSTTRTTTRSTTATRTTTKTTQLATARFKDGQLAFSFTGISSDGVDEWYVENGVVNYYFSGKVVFQGNTYDVVNGKVVRKSVHPSTTRNVMPAPTESEPVGHEHYWIAKYDGDAIVEDMSRFCQCPVCELRFKDRTLLESHAYFSGHVLSSDSANDAYNTGSYKQEVIVGYTNGIVEYVCKICGATTQDPKSESATSSTTKKPEEPTTKKDNPIPAPTLKGLVQGPDGKWAMYKNGAVDTAATGVFQNQYGWWRVEKGYVNFNAQGIYQNAYGWWKTTNGKVTFKENGVFQNQFGWWRVKDSKVDFNANGIYQNKYGWWKTKNGKVDFSFTGIAKNEYGTWYVKGGKVDFSKNGNVTYNGKTYTVANGKVK